MARYKIYDNKSDVITPAGEKLTAEQWLDRYQWGRYTKMIVGGGIINGEMLAAGLIDELSLVIYPGIDGLASSPSVFEYLGAADERPADGQSLELISAMPCPHGVVWLRYRFHHGTVKSQIH